MGFKRFLFCKCCGAADLLKPPEHQNVQSHSKVTSKHLQQSASPPPEAREQPKEEALGPDCPQTSTAHRRPGPRTSVQAQEGNFVAQTSPTLLGVPQMGFKRWRFKRIRGCLKRKPFFLRFLDFPDGAQALRKRVKKAYKGEKGRKWLISRK